MCGSMLNSNGVMDPFVLFNSFNEGYFNKVIRQPEIGDNYM